MVDLVYADRGEAYGRRDAMAEDGGCGIASVSVDEHAGDYAVAVEGLAVCEVGVGLPGVRGGVVPMEGMLAGDGKEGGTLDLPAADCEASHC